MKDKITERDEVAKQVFAEIRAMSIDDLKALLATIPDDDPEVLSMVPIIDGYFVDEMHVNIAKAVKLGLI
jgi:hypothetical protein